MTPLQKIHKGILYTKDEDNKTAMKNITRCVDK
jgi:hypothetical protein